MFKPLAFVVALLCASTVLAAGRLVVGVEDMQYLPAYATVNGNYQGFARELFDAFARDRGYSIEYRPLPVPRLYRSFLLGELDFKFPDNPKWQAEMRKGHAIVYSDPVIAIIDGVSLRPEKRGGGIGQIQVLGSVSGFSPWPWLERIKAGKTRLSENPDFEALVRQTLLGRVDGAYASVAMVNFQLDHVLKQPGALVFDPALPHTRDSYFMSTLKRSDVLAEFNEWQRQHRAEVDALKKKHGVEKGVVSK